MTTATKQAQRTLEDFRAYRGDEWVVTACNAHDDLVAALREVMDLAAQREVIHTVDNLRATCDAHERARALLAKVQS